MNVGVIGGHGFVGSGVCKALAAEDNDVSAISRENYDEMTGMHFDAIVNANGNSKKYLAEQDPQLDYEMSVESVSKSLTDFRFEAYIFISSGDVYSGADTGVLCSETDQAVTQCLSNYGRNKRVAEDLVKSASKRHLILRPSGFVGEGLKKNPIFDLLTGRGLWIHPDCKMQFINTVSFGRVIATLLKKGAKGLFNVTGEGQISPREIARELELPLTAGADDKPLLEYNLNLQKVRQYVELPSTRDEVFSFIQNWRSE
jgi:dTDP-4-dehydrorhamnose reductase